MAKTLTIELPEDLSEHLGIADDASTTLKALLLQTLQVLAANIQALQDNEPAARAKAARILGLIGTEPAIAALSPVLDDENSDVRQAATEALEQIGTEPALSLLAKERPPSPPPANADADFDPITPLIGTLEIETTSLAENHDQHLAAALEQELSPSE